MCCLAYQPGRYLQGQQRRWVVDRFRILRYFQDGIFMWRAYFDWNTESYRSTRIFKPGSQGWFRQLSERATDLGVHVGQVAEYSNMRRRNRGDRLWSLNLQNKTFNIIVFDRANRTFTRKLYIRSRGKVGYCHWIWSLIKRKPPPPSLPPTPQPRNLCRKHIDKAIIWRRLRDLSQIERDVCSRDHRQLGCSELFCRYPWDEEWDELESIVQKGKYSRYTTHSNFVMIFILIILTYSIML